MPKIYIPYSTELWQSSSQFPFGKLFKQHENLYRAFRSLFQDIFQILST